MGLIAQAIKSAEPCKFSIEFLSMGVWTVAAQQNIGAKKVSKAEYSIEIHPFDFDSPQNPVVIKVATGQCNTDVNNYAILGINRTDDSAPESFFTIDKPIVPQFRNDCLSFIRSVDPITDRERGAAEWKPSIGPNGPELLFVQMNNTHIERMGTAHHLRCDVARPASENWACINSNTEKTKLKRRHMKQLSRCY
ncbi:carboxylesterase [Colletotrichum orchidophilum]|uniref:Carboxylesterase n=1 Tax=Colletotrichum orchidophilum TaxID=1209926 RepID=A0A1G4BS75_9PEZI|nr:carboxylesterase [Colletotrichum orchidophilum]OHF04240.1 carboxylesterase [Colletotrichum orchidophilum]